MVLGESLRKNDPWNLDPALKRHTLNQFARGPVEWNMCINHFALRELFGSSQRQAKMISRSFSIDIRSAQQATSPGSMLNTSGGWTGLERKFIHDQLNELAPFFWTPNLQLSRYLKTTTSTPFWRRVDLSNPVLRRKCAQAGPSEAVIAPKSSLQDSLLRGFQLKRDRKTIYSII